MELEVMVPAASKAPERRGQRYCVHSRPRKSAMLEAIHLSGGVRGSYDAEQIDIKTPDDAGKTGNGTLIRQKSKHYLFHPGKLLINYLKTRGWRQNTAFYRENRGFFAIDFLDRLNGAVMAGHTLTKGKNDQQKA